MTNALILAAGTSSRLYPLTKEIPKCLLKVGGKEIISFQIDMLRSVGIKKITIVTGYKAEKIKEFLPNDINILFYPKFRETNNLLTLKSVSDSLSGDTLIMFSDLLLSFSYLRALIDSPYDCTMGIDKREILETTMFVETSEKRIMDVGPHIIEDKRSGNFIGMAFIKNIFVNILKNELESISTNDSKFIDKYYTEIIRNLIQEGKIVNFLEFKNNQVWYEIDTPDEYEECKELDINRFVLS